MRTPIRMVPLVPGRTAVAMVAVMMTVSGCANPHSRIEGALGGVMAGAAVGGMIGAVCCGDPVHGLPAGILIGGVAGGATGFLWPVESY